MWNFFSAEEQMVFIRCIFQWSCYTVAYIQLNGVDGSGKRRCSDERVWYIFDAQINNNCTVARVQNNWKGTLEIKPEHLTFFMGEMFPILRRLSEIKTAYGGRQI